MSIEITCACGRVLNAPDSAIGKKGRSKGCGSVIRIEAPVPEEPESDEFGITAPPGLLADADEIGIEDLERTARSAPRPKFNKQPAASPSAALPSIEPSLPPEPWYYGFLFGYAKLYLACSLIQFGLYVCLLFLPMDGGFESFNSKARAFGLLVSLAWLLSAALIACPIFLAVDTARNIRATRYGIK